MANAQLALSLPASVCPLSHTSAHLYLCLSHSLSVIIEKRGSAHAEERRWSLLGVSAEGQGAATSSGTLVVLHVFLKMHRFSLPCAATEDRYAAIK